MGKSYPHRYASITTEIMMGQCMDKSKSNEQDDPIDSNEQAPINAKDKFKKRPLLQPMSGANKRVKNQGKYQRATALTIQSNQRSQPAQLTQQTQPTQHTNQSTNLTVFQLI